MRVFWRGIIRGVISGTLIGVVCSLFIVGVAISQLGLPHTVPHILGVILDVFICGVVGGFIGLCVALVMRWGHLSNK